ncbi:MAG: hypothetical protein ACFB2X_24365 [Rivularia sp. (in: cyanobacteria)]
MKQNTVFAVTSSIASSEPTVYDVEHATTVLLFFPPRLSLP